MTPDGKKRQVDINYIVQQTSGTTPSGSQEQTEKPEERQGALNPDFVAWMMGFGIEWMDCAPQSLSSRRKRKQEPRS
jgi:hypothetical protein